MFLEDLGLSWEDRGELLLQINPDPAQGPERLAHLYGAEYVGKGYISQADFDAYHKFAIVRHPVDRIVSEYLYRYQRTPFWRTPSFPRFLNTTFETDFSNMARHLVPQTRYVLGPDGEMLVDQIIRFEDLGTAIPALAQDIFGAPRPLPYRNKTSKGSQRGKARLKARMSARIYDMFREDFDTFGYQL